jgi:hypothetical protein
VFGLGYAHAFRIAATDPFFHVVSAIGPEREIALLANLGLNESEETAIRERLAHGATAFADGEADTAEKIAAEGFLSRVGDVLHAREIAALVDYLAPGLAERGSSFDAIAEADNPKSVVIQLLQEIPTAWAQAEMKRLQHSNPQRRWTPNDQYDVNALSMAIVYCDAVVAESNWGTLMRNAGLDVRNSTELMTRPEELRSYLAAI